MPLHFPRMPAAPSLDDLRDAAPGTTADDLVHIATIAAFHLIAAGWEREADGQWRDPRGGGRASFAVAIDVHLRMVPGEGDTTD